MQRRAHTSQDIAFTKIRLPYGWLSNMSAHAIVHQGVVYPTAEHLFQCLRFASKDLSPIMQERSPMAAKMAAKQNADRMLVQPRSVEDLANMRLVLGWKLDQHPALLTALIATAPRQIYEDVGVRPSTSGTFWGAYLDQSDDTWVGENMLGHLWMDLRTERAAPPMQQDLFHT